MMSKTIFIKFVGVSVLVLGVIGCSTHFITASKVQRFFKNHSAQEQTIFDQDRDVAQRAYNTLLNFCGNQEKLDQVHSIKMLYGGNSKIIIFKFILGTHQYVGRLFPADYRENDFLGEVQAQSVAAQIGYSPKIYYHDAASRTIIMDFVQGTGLADIGIVQKSDSLVIQCAHKLRAIHDINEAIVLEKGFTSIRKYEHNFIGASTLSWIEKCEQQLSQTDNFMADEVDILKKCAHQLYSAAAQIQYKRALTHNDFHGDNIFVLDNGTLSVIDWTDAGFDNPLNDCAMLIVRYSPAFEQEEVFLTSYFGHSPTLQERAALNILKRLYLAREIATLISRCEIFKHKSLWSQVVPNKDVWEYIKEYCSNKKVLSDLNFLLSLIKSGCSEIRRYVEYELDNDKSILNHV